LRRHLLDRSGVMAQVARSGRWLGRGRHRRRYASSYRGACAAHPRVSEEIDHRAVPVSGGASHSSRPSLPPFNRTTADHDVRARARGRCAPGDRGRRVAISVMGLSNSASDAGVVRGARRHATGATRFRRAEASIRRPSYRPPRPWASP
jgi:hypothetical protein